MYTSTQLLAHIHEHMSIYTHTCMHVHNEHTHTHVLMRIISSHTYKYVITHIILMLTHICTYMYTYKHTYTQHNNLFLSVLLGVIHIILVAFEVNMVQKEYRMSFYLLVSIFLFCKQDYKVVYEHDYIDLQVRN